MEKRLLSLRKRMSLFDRDDKPIYRFANTVFTVLAVSMLILIIVSSIGIIYFQIRYHL